MNTNRSAQVFKSPTAACRFSSARSLSSRALFVVALFALACGEALAQEAAAQKQQMDGTPSAPPPMRYMPEDVRRRLEAERDPKARTRLSLELAEERLARVAEQAEADRFEAATGELGGYEAVVDDAIHFLKSSSPGRANNKTRDLLKRVEMTLREHRPRPKWRRSPTSIDPARTRGVAAVSVEETTPRRPPSTLELDQP